MNKPVPDFSRNFIDIPDMARIPRISWLLIRLSLNLPTA